MTGGMGQVTMRQGDWGNGKNGDKVTMRQGDWGNGDKVTMR